MRASLAGILVAMAVATTSACGSLSSSRPRCSVRPQTAAQFVLAANHLNARVISVRRSKILRFLEPAGGGPQFKRLYLVTFVLLKPNPVLGPGRHSFFGYVTRKSVNAPWCYLKGGSGP